MWSRKPGLIYPMDQSNTITDSVSLIREDGEVTALAVEAYKPINDEAEEFDASKKPPFTIGQIRAAIPKHCWERSMTRSFSYVAKDVAIVVMLACIAAILDSWLLWPLYWFAQGTMFWALFVLGHDCGHGSFSTDKTVNHLVGHVVHSFILVPYHGWRISHRTHHANHGHVENDESWYPMTETIYNTIDFFTRFGRTQFPLPLFAYPAYLWVRSPGKTGTHYLPTSDLFDRSEWGQVTLSTACWLLMVVILIKTGNHFGFLWLLKLYLVPYLVNVAWLDAVTYLHHHGYQKKVPWYRGQQWSYMRGGLSTIDRDYGWFNKIHHDIGTHVVHHLFPAIPHYHLCEATAAVKPLLGKYYRDPQRSGPIPLHLIPILLKSFAEDHFVADEGDILFYQTARKI